MRATRAIINLTNLRNNIREIKKLLKKQTRLCISVKANAYGHGAVECARVAVEEGADFLAVATPEEGVQLRNAGIKTPIIMLSLCSPEEIDLVVKNDITPFVFDEEYILYFAESCRKAGKTCYNVHIAVDTGMGRIGVKPDKAGDLAAIIEKTSVLHLGGIGTHFALSDDTEETSKVYTKEQYEKFLSAIKSVKDAGIDPGICHCANSAATLACPDMQLDMVRPGIIVYGYYADKVNEEYLSKKQIFVHLEPVMTLQTKVCSIRSFSKGESVGYGRTWVAKEDTDIAVLPIGYGDGLMRRFSKEGFAVSIHGKTYPIRGRICMDQCMIDIGKNNPDVHRWDDVIIFGSQKDGAHQSAEDVAGLTGTISYEITTCITNRVPRVIHK
ncbi:MAG: alanine racemase [Treponema sp.]|nr:alanine racemase [Treponema sp.]